MTALADAVAELAALQAIVAQAEYGWLPPPWYLRWYEIRARIAELEYEVGRLKNPNVRQG